MYISNIKLENEVYEIKDTIARQKIQELTSNVNNKNFVPNIEYMFTHHENDATFQGMCADSQFYYYASIVNNANVKIYKRSLQSNELINTYVDIPFGHCNDMCVLNDILYSADFKHGNNYSRKISYYNMLTNTTGSIDVFEINQALINQGYINISGISVYDSTHLICLLNKDQNVYNNFGIFLLDLSNNSFTQIEVENTKNINITDFYMSYQCIEYVNGKLFLVASHPTYLIELTEVDNKFEVTQIINIPTHDILGQSIGEMEGITKVPASFNGEYTLLLMSQTHRFSQNKMTLKFYCINPFYNLPNTAKRIGFELTYPNLQNNIIVKANSSNYYEDGTADYPFKDLLSAIECSQFSTIKTGKQILIYAGQYDISQLRNFNNFAVASQEEGVIFNGSMSFNNCQNVYIGGAYTITFNTQFFHTTNSKITFNNIILNETGTNTLTMELGSVVKFINSVANLTNYFVVISNSHCDIEFSTIQRTNSQYLFNVTSGTLICRNNNVLPANIGRGAGGIVQYAGYINAPQ